MLMGVRAERDRLMRRSEAVASWAEMLRDTIAAHAGLQEAIAVTARVAPAPIRTEVQTLAVRAEPVRPPPLSLGCRSPTSSKVAKRMSGAMRRARWWA